MTVLQGPSFTDDCNGAITVDPNSFGNFLGLGGPGFGFGTFILPTNNSGSGGTGSYTSKGVPPNIFQQNKKITDATNYLKTLYSPAKMDYFIEVNSYATLKFSDMLQKKFPNSIDPNSSDYNDAKNLAKQLLQMTKELTPVLQQMAVDNTVSSGGFKLFGRVLAKVLKSRAAKLLPWLDAAMQTEAAFTSFQAGNYSAAAVDIVMAIVDVAPVTELAKEIFSALGIAQEAYDIFQPLSKIYYFCEAKGLQIFEKVFEFIETKGLFSGLGYEVTTKGIPQLYIDLAGQKVESIFDYLKSLGVSTDLDTGGFNIKVSDGIFVTFYPLNFYPKPGEDPYPSIQINIEGQKFKIRLKNPG